MINTGKILSILGATSLLLGSLMPWATIRSDYEFEAFMGYEGVGLYSGVVGLILLLITAVRKGKPQKRYSILLSAIYGLFGPFFIVPRFIEVGEIVNYIQDEGLFAAIGIGLYLSALGTIIGFVGGLIKVPDQPIDTNA